jgi:hypothetical protein
MKAVAALVVCLVAAAQAQEGGDSTTPAPLAPPVWFLESSLQGSFAERSAACADLFPAREASSSKGPIFIPEDQPASICINFPPRVLPDGKELKGGWRNDQGEKGACANGCCEFKPPTKKQAEAAAHPTWFETTTGDCSSVPAATNTAPLLFKGKVRNINLLLLQLFLLFLNCCCRVLMCTLCWKAAVAKLGFY